MLVIILLRVNKKSKYIQQSSPMMISTLLQVRYKLKSARDNGTIQVYNVQKKCLSYTLSNNDKKVPFSYIAWRP